ncbi:MAG: ATP-binding cassette domain-containing protein [Dehalococcoidia bacterium]|nr:ATP-binding cassette domain-containing protein [Dehalococcoidia bacterium]
MTAAAGLRLHGVSHAYPSDEGGLAAIDHISLDIEAGEFLSMVGPSGCGKSTLLRIIGGLLAPSAGSVEIEGLAPRRAQREMRVGYVFQEPALLPWRSVRRNIELPLEIGRGRVPASARTATDLMDLVGLSAFAEYEPAKLSGGMRQRVAIARALAFDPPLLLMDEPFGALDEITREAMRQELQRVWTNSGKTVVFVTHSIREAALLSDRVAVLSPRPGRLVGLFEIPLPRPRSEEIEEDPRFLACLADLRRALRSV